MTTESLPAASRTGLAGLLRLTLMVLALALLALPFGVAWRLLDPKTVVSRIDTGVAATQPSAIGRWYNLGAALPATAAPVVLAYHDVRPDSTDPYVVSPDQLDQQLTALEAAGYHTLTSEQYAEYLETGVAPARSVYITFDDGTEGLWLYADRVLARHHAHAASFLITGHVGQAGQYYLKWDQVEQMATDGVWDFQAHTHLLHQKVVTGPGGKLGSKLMNVDYDPATGAYQSAVAHRQAVNADLDALAAAFSTHGLSPALFFAYPFSETVAQSNTPAAATLVEQLISGRFLASFTNNPPEQAGAGVHTQIQRYEILASTTTDELVEQVINWTAVGPSSAGLTDAGRWTDRDGKLTTAYPVLTGSRPAPVGYTIGYFAPHATAAWTGYRVDATVTGLAGSADTVSVLVRTAGTPVAVRVSDQSVQVVTATGAKPARELKLPVLAAGARRTVSVTVGATSTTVTVGGRYTVTVPTTAGNGGGIALAVNHGRTGKAPAFSALAVTRS